MVDVMFMRLGGVEGGELPLGAAAGRTPQTPGSHKVLIEQPPPAAAPGPVCDRRVVLRRPELLVDWGGGQREVPPPWGASRRHRLTRALDVRVGVVARVMQADAGDARVELGVRLCSRTRDGM